MAKAGSKVPDVYVYIKSDCHLCDTLMVELELALEKRSDAIPPTVLIRDIEDRDDWYALYREYVPVVVVNDEEICHYFFDQQEFDQALRK